jgi:PKD repeat protein
MVDFFDESTGFPDAWEWTFEGGDPETSTDENPSGIMYPEAGAYNVTLVAFNNAGSDTLTKTAYIEVAQLPGPPVGTDEEACVGSTIPDLYAEGTDVQWYEDSLLTHLLGTGNTFATGQTEPGEYSYYATQTSDGCESHSTIVTLTIHELPQVSMETFAPLCISEEPFALSGGFPAGGSYSGDGVMDGMFYPEEAGAGIHAITYTYTDENGCANDAMQEITVYALPDVSLEPFAAVCFDAEPITLSGGTPEGGEYSGDGVEDGMFYPAVAGAGSHEIEYTYEDENGCENTAMQTIAVNPLPDVDAGDDAEVCAGDEITLDATTAGATSYEWYPGGETSAQITVDTSGYGFGSHMFIVTVTDENDCVASDTVTIVFKDCSAIGELTGVNNIRLYPNPGQGVFSLHVETAKPVELNVRVYNYNGVAVFEKQHIKIEQSQLINLDLTGQSSGVYLVTVWNNQGKWVEKLVVRN